MYAAPSLSMAVLTCLARWGRLRSQPPVSLSHSRPEPTHSAAARTSTDRIARATGLCSRGLHVISHHESITDILPVSL